MAKTNPETIIQSEVLTALNYLPGVFAYRVGNHAVPVLRGRDLIGWRKDKWRALGHADVICLLRGKVVFIEVKRPGGKLSPDQVKFRDLLEAHDIDYEVVESAADAVGMITAMQARCNNARA